MGIHALTGWRSERRARRKEVRAALGWTEPYPTVLIGLWRQELVHECQPEEFVGVQEIRCVNI